MTNNCRPELNPVPQRVESERLVIRPTRRSDAPYLKKWWNDPAITGPGNDVSGMQYDDEDMEDWFRRYVDGRECHTHFIISLRGDDQPIGEFYIASDDRPGCVGVALLIGDTDKWGQGYGGEALDAYAGALFATDHCGAIRVDVSNDNTRAIRMCEKVGFEVEHVWANGRFTTMILTEDAYALKHSRADE